MSVELKVKAVSLADEARTIRREELKAKKAGDRHTRESLYLHRIQVVRPEARATHLARAYISGLRYRQVEAHTRLPIQPHMIDKVCRMLDRFGCTAETPEIVAWFSEPEEERKEAA